MKKKRIIFLFVTILAIVAMTACQSSKPAGSSSGKTADSSKSTLEKCKESGSITIGFANEVPYAYQDENGELKGEAVDIAREILGGLGITEIKGELVEFSALISGLKAGRYDMIAAGMAVTEERAGEVLFATPEISYGEALLVAKGNPKGLKSYGDIAADGSVKVAIPSGVIEQEYLLKSGVSEDQIQITNDLSSSIQALKTGRVDCVNASNTSLATAMAEIDSENLELVGDFEQAVIDGTSTIMYGSSAFRLEDEDFQKVYSEGVSKLEESGKLQEILENNGFNQYNLPGSVTVEDIIGK